MQKVDIEDIPFGHFRLWALKFVNRGAIPNHVDECTLRNAVFRVPLRALKVVFWDMWAALAEESSALAAGILSFLGGATLIGIFWALFVINPEILVKTLIGAGIFLGLIFLIVVVAVGLTLLTEENRAERFAYAVADSMPAKATGSFAKLVWSVIKWPLMPIKWIAFDLVWVRLLRESGDNAAGVFLACVLLFVVGVVLFLLVYNLIFNTFIALVGLGIGLGVLLIAVLVILFFVAGGASAIKERVCRPVGNIE